MFKRSIYYYSDKPRTRLNPLALNGAVLFLLGLFILFFPQLLIALVAGSFMFLGGMLMFFAYRVRRNTTRAFQRFDDFFNSN